jgi:amino acid transporter
MQIGLYGLFAAAAAGFFSENLGINLPWWVYAFIAMAIIAVLGYRQVDLSVKVLSILVSLEFLIVLILDAAILIKGGEGGTAPLNATPFTWASFTSGSIAIALLFNFASFIGFEATTIYSEEARDPKRTVPRGNLRRRADDRHLLHGHHVSDGGGPRRSRPAGIPRQSAA